MTTNDENDPDAYRFNWHELPQNDFTNWAMVSMWSQNEKTADGDDMFDALSKATDRFTDVKLTIQVNGVEMDAEKFMERMDRANADLAERKAAAKVKDMLPVFESMTEFISDMEADFKRKAYARAKELGINSSEWEDRW